MSVDFSTDSGYGEYYNTAYDSSNELVVQTDNIAEGNSSDAVQELYPASQQETIEMSEQDETDALNYLQEEQEEYETQINKSYEILGTTASGSEVRIENSVNLSVQSENENKELELSTKSKYDKYQKQAQQEGNEDWSFDRYESEYIKDGNLIRTQVYGMIDVDNNSRISTGMGKDYNAYCEYEYREEWKNENFLYKVADDMDNNGQYQVTYYDSKGNVSIEGVDTDLDGIVDSDIKTNNNCDGKIDVSYQGGTGDCWLLSAMNSMSYSEEGAEILQNAIDVQEDGSTIVHTYVGDYTISLDELKEAKLAMNQDIDSNLYSTGDDDVLILELTTEKVLNDYADGKIEFPLQTSLTEYLASAIKQGISFDENSSIEGNLTDVFNYIMTGQESSINVSLLQMNDALNKMKNGEADSTCVNFFFTDRTLEGPDGNVSIQGNHVYAVKEIKDGVATLVNPWESDKEIKVYKTELIQYGNIVETIKYN